MWSWLLAVSQSWACDPAVPVEIRATACPRRSDVMLRSLSPHFAAQPPPSRRSKSQGDGMGLYDTWGASAAFHANRLDWVYSYNGSFISGDARSHQMRVVTATINANLPDAVDGRASYDIGRVTNVLGETIGAPWMRTWANPPKYGCINNPEYIEIVHTAVMAILDGGAAGVQHDDPATNGGAVAWDGGDPTSSGCYCSHCMQRFAKVLDQQLNATVKARLNFTSQWDYREYLLRPPGTAPGLALLRGLFVAFQRNSSEAYIDGLRTFIHNRAPVALSCNNGGRWTSPYHLCDYGMGELDWDSATVEGLEAVYVDNVPFGRSQVMTMPKRADVTSSDSRRVRWSIATAYALGGNMIIPWDTYLPTPDAERSRNAAPSPSPGLSFSFLYAVGGASGHFYTRRPPSYLAPGTRYFGSAATYGDLYAFVRQNSLMLDESRPLPSIENASRDFRLVYTGAGGDGRRFRLPSDTSKATNGSCTESVGLSVRLCERKCLKTEGCTAIFSSLIGGAGTCCVLKPPLVEVAGTSMIGKSFLKLHNATSQAFFRSNVTSTTLYPLITASGTLVLHIIDEAYVEASGVAAVNGSKVSPVQLITINGTAVPGMARCGSYRTGELLRPGFAPAHQETSCVSNTTWLVVPGPLPWSVIRLKP